MIPIRLDFFHWWRSSLAHSSNLLLFSFVTFFLDAKSNQKNQGFSFNLTHRSFNAPTIVLRSESFFTLLNSLKCRWSPAELSPFSRVSVRVKNHFMKCRGRRMVNFWRRWEREERSMRSRVQIVQFFCHESSKCSIPRNYIVSLKPNFYTELGCEVSGDAARESANWAIEPKHAAKVRQRWHPQRSEAMASSL